jgi:serpin B
MKERKMKIRIIHAVLVLGLLVVSGCAGAPTPAPVEPSPPAPILPEPTPPQLPSELPEIKSISSAKERLIAPESSEQDIQELVQGNNRFAFDLYQSIRGDGDNLFYSPYSISLALAMTYAGARGETANQIAETLQFNLPDERLHSAFNQLDLILHSRGESVSEEDGRGFTLNIVNSLWGQEGYAFLSEFLDVLAENYGAGLQLLDFENAAEAARQVINEWVMEQTNDRIEDLIPEGVINSLTRLVLANAIYFDAAWSSPFEAEFTKEAEFSLLDGSKVEVPLMNQTQFYNYSSGEDFQAIELPYQGYEMSMVILHPDPQAFETFESSLTVEQLEEILKEMDRTNIDLSLPKFEFDMNLPLAQVLQELGMVDAFEFGPADFSGMDGTRELYIQDVLHKAFVSVDEEGTEAAAATAVVIGVTSAPMEPFSVKIDSPFIFLIRDMETNSILFLGRMLNPAP